MVKALRILVPLDGSRFGEPVVDLLSALAKRGAIQLTLMRVVESAESFATATEYLERRLSLLKESGIVAQAQVIRGEPAAALVAQARPEAFDGVAMTSWHREAAPHEDADSVAEAVSWASPIPVLVSRPGMLAFDDGPVLVALDGTRASEAILPEAVRWAKLLGARLQLLRVNLPLLAFNRVRGVDLWYEDCLPEHYTEKLGRRLESEGLEVVAEECSGFAGEEILNRVEETGARLLCMATSAPHDGPALERSATRRAIRKALCPVLVGKNNDTLRRTPG